WPGESSHSYVSANPVVRLDWSGESPPSRVTGTWVLSHATKTLAKCGLNAVDAAAIGAVFKCIALGESGFVSGPKADTVAVNGIAYGLYQLGSTSLDTSKGETGQFEDCCQGDCDNARDPEQNLNAAINLWISMCNDSSP